MTRKTSGLYSMVEGVYAHRTSTIFHCDSLGTALPHARYTIFTVAPMQQNGAEKMGFWKIGGSDFHLPFVPYLLHRSVPVATEKPVVRVRTPRSRSIRFSHAFFSNRSLLAQQEAGCSRFILLATPRIIMPNGFASFPPLPKTKKKSLRKVCTTFIGRHHSVRSTPDIEVRVEAQAQQPNYKSTTEQAR